MRLLCPRTGGSSSCRHPSGSPRAPLTWTLRGYGSTTVVPGGVLAELSDGQYRHAGRVTVEDDLPVRPLPWLTWFTSCAARAASTAHAPPPGVHRCCANRGARAFHAARVGRGPIVGAAGTASENSREAGAAATAAAAVPCASVVRPRQTCGAPAGGQRTGRAAGEGR